MASHHSNAMLNKRLAEIGPLIMSSTVFSASIFSMADQLGKVNENNYSSESRQTTYI